MQYKGDDLDLRVPQGRPPRDTFPAAEYEPVNGRWPRTTGYAASPSEPMWVDEALLACCNYAYDVAHANGAAEVGLEHLVNAMTRVEAAARMLEARGVREGQLRRESAALIASEMSTKSQGGGNVTPRRSMEFEDVLRRAAEVASRRGVPASIDEVLWVLLHSGRETPAVLLLRRFTPDWQRLDFGRSRELSMPEPQHLSPRPPIGLQAAPQDGLGMRMATIEDGLRIIHSEISSERKHLGDLVRDIQRDIVAQRSDGAALRGEIAQRLDSVERSVAVRGEASRLPIQVIDRMQALEKAVNNGLTEGARTWASLGQRLQAVETGLSDAKESPATRHLVERLTALERLGEASAGETGRHWTALADRLGKIEAHLSARPATTAMEDGELGERLGGLERALRNGFGEAAQMTMQVADRIGVVESELKGGAPDDEAILILDDRLQVIERMLEDRRAETSAGTRAIVDRLQQIETRALAVSTPSIDFDRLTIPVTERLVALESRGAERGAELQALLSQLHTRLMAVEETGRQDAAAAEAALRARDTEIAALRDAVIHLSDSQQTLISSIVDWRKESHGDLGMINVQLEKLTPAPPPAAPAVVDIDNRRDLPNIVRANTATAADATESVVTLPETGAEPDRVRSIEGAVPARRGRSFWWWLFGTGNIAQANREAEIRWERMHQRIKEARQRRKGEV